jgi:spermidine/putrescine transport system permease protein
MKTRRAWLLSFSLANLLFLYVPIAVLIVFSFNASQVTARWDGLTFNWYRVMVKDASLFLAVENSLLVAVVSTLIATVLGVSAAVSLERFPFRGPRVVDGALLLPLVIPEVMMGVALLLFFVMIDLPLSLVTITIGHTAFNVPLVMVIVRARLRKLDPGLEEAARDLGATPWLAFRRVTLPLLMPAILGAILMAFTVSLDDFIVTFFTAGPGATTLPLKVYSMIKTGVSPVINALSTIIVLMSMALIGLSLILQRRGVGV